MSYFIRRFVFLALILFGVSFWSSFAASEPNTDPLSEYRWKNRLLVVCDRETEVLGGSGFISRAMQLAGVDEAKDAKIAVVSITRYSWIMIDPNAFPPPSVENQLSQSQSIPYSNLTEWVGCASEQKMSALVGLDGFIKKVWRGRLPELTELMDLINAMPMRQQELRDAAKE